MEASVTEVHKHIMTINRDFKENVIKKVHTVKLNDTDVLNKKVSSFLIFILHSFNFRLMNSSSKKGRSCLISTSIIWNLILNARSWTERMTDMKQSLVALLIPGLERISKRRLLRQCKKKPVLKQNFSALINIAKISIIVALSEEL